MAKESGSNQPADPAQAARGRETLEQLAQEALRAFRADAKGEYAQLVKTYEGCSAVIGIFGLGSITLAVSKGEVHLNPKRDKVPTRLLGRGAIYPETVVAISRGEITPLEAFHKGELLARAESSELHRAYEFMVKFSEAALRSPKLQQVLGNFRTRTAC